VPLPADALFSLPEKSFNAITLWHVMEHVHDLHGYLKKIESLLVSGGKIFIAVPNHTSFDAHHYREYWAAYDVPRHLYHFSPSSMNALLKAYGLQIEEIKPMWFDSFYVSLLSEKYRKGIAGFIKACIIGALSNLNTLFRKEKCSSLIYVVRKA
jgi:ubiquinone/menaquinone biosynthesis C-methylase UbiE